MTSLPELGQLVADKYRLECVLGEGGMGTVFRAQHLLMERPVALKLMRPELAQHAEARDRFLREARAAGRIRHPHVVDVYDVGLHEGALYIVMELLEGEHFEDLMRRGDVPTADLLQLLLGAMYGVAAAHRHGIVHRDIKPENLFVVAPTAGSRARIKVLDFGISKLVDEPHRDLHLTQVGTAVGTPLFMSMEQLSGAPDVDARADVYSFGVLLYRALTGVIPFDAESVAAIAVLIATYRPPSPKQLRPELPEALARVVMKAMAYERDDRHESMEALIVDIVRLDQSDRVLGGVAAPSEAALALHQATRSSFTSIEIPAPAGPAGSVLPTRSLRRSARTSLAAATAVALVSAALWHWLGGPRSAESPIAERAEPARSQPAVGAAPAEARPPLSLAPAATPPSGVVAPPQSARAARTAQAAKPAARPGVASRARQPAAAPPPSPVPTPRVLLRQPDF